MVWLFVHYGGQRRRDLVTGAAQSRDSVNGNRKVHRFRDLKSALPVCGGYPGLMTGAGRGRVHVAVW